MEHSRAIEHLSRDERLGQVIATVGLPPLTADGDLYRGLLRAIVYQQLSGKAAGTIFGRFLGLFPDGYPHAQQLATMEPETLRAVGLSRQKLSYLQNVANFFLDGQIEAEKWSQWDDEAAIQHLTQIKGVGRWTVQMLLLFNLGRPDIFAPDDLGIQQAMIRLYDIRESGRALRQRMAAIAEPWRPYRSYACRYLWRWNAP
ncbi:MAG: DNA-3-methyladenine glycosylase 2 family protein [Phaeodactylibacter sp.]|nr:DNA-3-methyladenine glycosylase 2 family protein [Phaeodactylibacter sp.]MCB9275521.1 DNA-3-methyladenine glycosylase 2 family protein [Lewinellaceae bacterium]